MYLLSFRVDTTRTKYIKRKWYQLWKPYKTEVVIPTSNVVQLEFDTLPPMPTEISYNGIKGYNLQIEELPIKPVFTKKSTFYYEDSYGILQKSQ